MVGHLASTTKISRSCFQLEGISLNKGQVNGTVLYGCPGLTWYFRSSLVLVNDNGPRAVISYSSTQKNRSTRLFSTSREVF